MKQNVTTPIRGIRYYTHANPHSVISARDGKVIIPCGDLPIPLQESDFNVLDGREPTYDEVGRGIYLALRSNPDCCHAARYARILRDAYPHFVSELASHMLMLEKKDVDVAYLDRKIVCLKIFALLEPDNPTFPLEIGLALLEKGTTLATLQNTTVTLYRAEAELQRAVELSPDAVAPRVRLAEVSYLLGRYEVAASLWQGLLPLLSHGDARSVRDRLEQLAEGKFPRVPVVDYLEAIGVAFEHYHLGEWEEAAALLHDIVEDQVLCSQYPLPQLWYLLGLCTSRLAMPRYAEDYLRRAIELQPDYPEAQAALRELTA